MRVARVVGGHHCFEGHFVELGVGGGWYVLPVCFFFFSFRGYLGMYVGVLVGLLGGGRVWFLSKENVIIRSRE